VTAREAALRALLAGGDAAGALDRALSDAQLSERDRAFATELAHGTLKRRRTLEWSVQTCLNRPFEKLQCALQWVLMLGAYQILYLDRVPVHSAVGESVTLARSFGHEGHASLTNAVLRRLAREKPLPPMPESNASAPDKGVTAATLGLATSLPDWIAQALIDRFGEARAIRIAQNLNLPPRRALRVDLAKWDVAQARQALESAGFAIAPGELGISECLIVRSTADADRQFLRDCLANGSLALQSEESQLAVHLLAPQPGETVLDVCAGRGVKTSAIAARLRGSGNLVALDDDRAKLALLENASKTFATPVSVVGADARNAYPAAVPRNADAVLVDAPCSALGILGRRADVRWRKRAQDPERFAKVQRAVLARAAEHVRPGGRLLYVTCSFVPVEDEGVINQFLAGAEEWRAGSLAAPAAASGIERIGSALLTEPGRDGSDGFFYALLERRA
jgi:16S rRNA (cytosine967-C5)-methyltransferase